MKSKAIMLLVLLASTLVGCKDEKSVDSLQVVTPETDPNRFKITVNAVVSKNDDFQFFYNEDGSENYIGGDEMVNLSIKGNDKAQDLVFILPVDAKPMNLRFDLGANKDLKNVKFNSFLINYNGKTFKTDGAKFFKYFYPNGQVSCDTLNSTAKIIEKPNEAYDPIIGATPDLKKEIEKLYK
jgi:hypothetical protein